MSVDPLADLDSFLDQSTIVPEDNFRPSGYQQAVFEAVRKPEQDLLIQAVAGSGKTTTIIKAMDYAPGSSLFMAFNKAIAEDIRSKAQSGEVKTLNALGHGLMTANRPRAKLNARKLTEIIKGIMGETEEFREHGWTLARVCGLAKNLGLGLEASVEAGQFADIIDAYGFDIPAEREDSYATICREAFERSRLDTATFDFDDQLWVPISERWQFPRYDNLFIDEAQDLSPIQHLMLEWMSADQFGESTSRIVAVGDRHQAIYGFRGASHNSMNELKAMFGMTELPLSICYRCSQAVVLAAQEMCPEIRHREGAPQGDILWRTSDVDDFAQYMVLCRTNAPLFREILRRVRAKQPTRVLSSFLESFQGFIRGFKATYTSDLEAKLDRWKERECEAAKKRGSRAKLAGILDRYDTVKLLCREYRFVWDMVQMVKSLGESTRGPIFATIHKAKGLESPHVYLLRPDLLGGFGELTDEQTLQEQNLHYVAITRAQETLTYGAKVR